jgi:hypothetical protein
MGLILTYFNQQMNMSKYLDFISNIITSNSKNLQKENITFIDNKYKAITTFERGILNLFQVIDQKANIAQYKIIKTYQIKNEESLISKVTNFLNTIASLSNDKLIKIEDFKFENTNKKGKILRLYILEEYNDYISLQQFLGLFYDDYISRKLTVNINTLYEELISLCCDIMEFIDSLHSQNIFNVNMSLNNIMYCKAKHTFVVKFTDIESGELHRINFGNDDIKLSAMQNMNNDDYHNFQIILFQLIFFIKNLSLKNAFDYTVMYDFFKTDIKIIQNELTEIFESDSRLAYFKYLLRYISENAYDKIKELNSLYKDIMKKNLELKYDSEIILDMLFSLIQSNENYLEYFFNILNEYRLRDNKWLLNYLIEKQHIQNIITRYINFIQIHYHNNKNVDLMDVINECLNDYNLPEEIPKMKVYGIFPLFLAYLNNCDIDYNTTLSLMRKFSSFNTCSIVNIAEKINFNNSLSKFFEISDNMLNNEITDNLTKILPMLR